MSHSLSLISTALKLISHSYYYYYYYYKEDITQIIN